MYRLSMPNPPAKALLAAAIVILACCGQAYGGILTFNSPNPAANVTTGATWLGVIGISGTQYLADFETGFTNGQNITGVPGLFPAGLVITDTDAGQAIIRSGAGVIHGSNPVGLFALTQNERPFLELDFSIVPVDYVAFQDINHAGTRGWVTVLGGAKYPISFETTAAWNDTAEFFGIFRNDMPRIIKVELGADRRGQVRSALPQVGRSRASSAESAPAGSGPAPPQDFSRTGHSDDSVRAVRRISSIRWTTAGFCAATLSFSPMSVRRLYSSRGLFRPSRTPFQSPRRTAWWKPRSWNSQYRYSWLPWVRPSSAGTIEMPSRPDGPGIAASSVHVGRKSQNAQT